VGSYIDFPVLSNGNPSENPLLNLDKSLVVNLSKIFIYILKI